MDKRPVVVIKVGTSSIIDPDTRVTRVSALSRVAEAAVALINAGCHVVLVSSGAVGLGCARLGLKSKPTTMAGKQAAAAVGQVRLMALYDDIFSVLGHRCAQVLLTYDTFGERTQYLNARNTFLELLRMGAIPVVNENDTVAVQELRVGDNDSMSALVAAMIGAQWLFLMTDVESLYDADPRKVPTAGPLRVVPMHAIADLRRQMLSGAPRLVLRTGDDAPSAATSAGSGGGVTRSGSAACLSAAAPSAAASGIVASATAATRVTSPSAAAGSTASSASGSATAASASASATSVAGNAGSAFGTGGFVTKLKAAQLATAAGVTVVITCTDNIEKVSTLLASTTTSTTTKPTSSGGSSSSAHSVFVDAGIGSTFLPAPKPATGRKRWIMSLAPAGTITLDAGAVEAVVASRKSLFPAGIVAVSGDFEAHDAVQIVDATGNDIARALVNYSGEDVRKIRGKRSKEMHEALGYLGAETVADRDNIVLLHVAPSAASVAALGAAAAAATAACGGAASAVVDASSGES